MANEPYLPQQPRPRRFPVLKIIGTMLLVMILICGGLVTYVAYNARGWAAGFARGPLLRKIDQFDLSDEQKVLIKQKVSGLADEFKSGKMSYTQLMSILEKLSQEPFITLVTVEAMQNQYTLAHPNADAERKDTMLLFDRFERGIIENTIPRQDVRNVMALANDPDQARPGGQKNTLTEAELRPFIDAMRKAVESAKIPAEPFEPDFAGQIDQAVNAVLGPSAPTTATAPAERTEKDTGGQAASGTRAEVLPQTTQPEN